ncbi:MAG: hypothetical protein LBT43_23075, partial [Prevotella sp.]|nr:hypothetical protein [Prevotella sp.]
MRIRYLINLENWIREKRNLVLCSIAKRFPRLLEYLIKMAIKNGYSPCRQIFCQSDKFDFCGLRVVYNLLEDSFSKNMFLSCITARSFFHYEIYKPLVSPETMKKMMITVEKEFRFGDGAIKRHLV